MQIVSTTGKFKSGKRKGRVVKGVVNGKKISFRLCKHTPEGCSEARRICVKCLTKVIDKRDSNFESKICKQCAESR